MSAIKAFNPLGQTIQWQSRDYVIRGFAPASRVADIPFNHGMALLVIVDGRSVYLHESEVCLNEGVEAMRKDDLVVGQHVDDETVLTVAVSDVPVRSGFDSTTGFAQLMKGEVITPSATSEFLPPWLQLC